MYIDVVPDKVISTVHWLHHLNYEPIACTSSTCYLVCTRNDLGQTVTSYGWCNDHVSFLSIDFSQNNSCLTVFLTEGKRVFHVSILFLVRLGNGFASGRLSYRPAYTYLPRQRYHVTVLGICVSVRMYVISTSMYLTMVKINQQIK